MSKKEGMVNLDTSKSPKTLPKLPAIQANMGGNSNRSLGGTGVTTRSAERLKEQYIQREQVEQLRMATSVRSSPRSRAV